MDRASAATADPACFSGTTPEVGPAAMTSARRKPKRRRRWPESRYPAGCRGSCVPISRRSHAPACEHMFVTSEATILHADVDAFFASVEQRDDPRLRGRPVIVGAGVVLAESTLVSVLGRAACRHLHALAHNRDPRPVHPGRRRRSMGSQRALGRSRPPPDAVDAVVIALVDRVTRRMRAAGRVGRTVVLRLRFDDFSRATRSHTLPWATAHTQTILGALRGLLVVAMPTIQQQGLTL